MIFKTSCAKCLFAKFNENGVQNGCELGRLEKYQEKGLANLDGNSYLIDSFCKTCVRKDQDGLELTPKAMREAIKINAIFIINGLEKDYWPLLKSILKQTLMPSKVVVIVKEFKEVDRYKEYLKHYTDKESNLLIKKYYTESPDFYECVNDSVSRFSTDFYTILDGDSTIPEDYLEKIDIRINDDMEPLVAVFSDGEYRNTFAIKLHSVFGGQTKGKTLKQKIVELNEIHKEAGNVWDESTL